MPEMIITIDENTETNEFEIVDRYYENNDEQLLDKDFDVIEDFNSFLCVQIENYHI